MGQQKRRWRKCSEERRKKFNDTVNYSNRAFDFGFRADHIPDIPVYAAREGEEVFMTVLPFNGVPVEEIEESFDAVDYAVVEELGRSKYFSSLQVYQFVGLRGFTVQRHGVRNRLNKMMKLRVRSTPHAMRKLADKVNRYYILINDSRYRENNYYGHETVPQLVICGENYEHCVKIDRYLRSRGLISETDSLLYTEDLFYVRQTLQNLYELDEAGNRTWYSLPERQMVTDMGRSA